MVDRFLSTLVRTYPVVLQQVKKAHHVGSFFSSVQRVARKDPRRQGVPQPEHERVNAARTSRAAAVRQASPQVQKHGRRVARGVSRVVGRHQAELKRLVDGLHEVGVRRLVVLQPK